MKKLIIILFLFPVIVFSEEYILVKQIWGKVNLIESEKKEYDLVVYSTIKPNHQIELLNKKSKVWIRDNNNNDLIIEYDQVNKYSYNDIKNLISINNKQIKEKSFANKFLSLISLPSKKIENEINGMLISSKTGVSRNLNDTNVTLIEDVLILEGFPFKIDFSNFFSDIDENTYSIMINDKWSKKRLFEFETTESYFEFENQDVEVSFGINWVLKISNSENPKSILGNISSLYLSFESLKLLNELKEKALDEIGSKESLFQKIFIEVLLSKDLDVNASYYLDFFDLKK